MAEYEAYKDSGVEWLGRIPECWEVISGKRFFTVQKQINKGNNFQNILSLTLRGVVNNNLDNPEGLVPKDYGTYQIFEKGDLVFKLIDLENFRTSRVGLVHERGAMSPAYIRLCVDSRFDEKYIFYYYYNLYLNAVFNKLGAGVRSTLGPTDLLDMPILKFALKEQKGISIFLDKKIAQINEAVTIKEKQIELLKERKKIIIQQAVTQGLSPNVPMKDSGVEWIGKIPEHWEIIRFKNLFTQSRLPVRADDGVVTSFRDGQVTLRSNRRLTGFTEAVIEGGYQGIRKGQLVLNSMDAFEGAIGVSDSDGKCTPEYVICDPKVNNISQHYFAYLLREMALAKYIQVICNAVRQRAVRIRFNNLASRFMVVPPIEEQEVIVQHIQNESKKIDDGIEHLKSQIEKFKEYKTTLINSAVTGKIKVPQNQESVLS